jgi:TonB-dependent SusC/RagA subfamily outer membrane receptor
VYTDDQLAKAKPISLKVSNMHIEDVLKQIFKDQPLTYTINSSTIIINDKEKSVVDRVIDYFTAIDISGKIVDENGNPLVGATIRVKGSDRATTTDKSGGFILTGVDKNSILEISYVGYRTFEIRGARNLGTITMEVATAGLQEVVVVNTGYQKIQQTKLTGSVTTVGREQLEKRNVTNIMQNLEGVVPGLVQTRLRTSIRGLSTIDNTMRGILFVVDGLPIEGNIGQINPYDVESVSVLKDAAAAAIYGARASNGVIVITTRRAKEVGKTVIEATGNVTVTDKPDYSYQDWMSPSQQVDYESDYYKWWFNGGGNGGPVVANPIGDFENRINSSTFITPIAYAYYQQKKRDY